MGEIREEPQIVEVESIERTDYKFSKMEIDSCFVVGGITDVPAKEFNEHIELINSILYLLEFRYGVDSRTALRDAEGNLDEVAPENRAEVCYKVDQMHVSDSKFLVAILNCASTGTGQELERAAALNTPILALVKAPHKTKLGVKKRYVIRYNNGKTESRGIHVSEGELSIMVAGNPSIKKIINYSQDRIYGVRRIRHIVEKFGWVLKNSGFEKIGNFALRVVGNLHKNCSSALEELDEALQKHLGLTPRTAQIDNRIKQLEQIKDLNGNAKLIEREVLELREQKRLLNNLLEYNPLRLNHELEKYSIFRLHSSRTAHMFTKKYSTKKIGNFIRR